MDSATKPRLRAVVDWIEVQINTPKPSNMQTIQRAFAAAVGLADTAPRHRVEALDEGEGGAAQSFSVRLHDVERYGDIERLMAKVSDRIDLLPGFSIAKVEVSLDVFCTDPASMVTRLYRGLANLCSENRRLYRVGKGSAIPIPNREESLRRDVSNGYQIGIGNKTDYIYQHAYLKDTDTQGGKRQPVQPRARLEVQLSELSGPRQVPEDWGQFRFERLTDHFRQRQADEDLTSLHRDMLKALPNFGERRPRKKRNRDTRLYSKSTSADPINRDIHEALRNLSKRWRAGGRKACPTD